MFSSGPTNSIRDVMFLSDNKDGIVVDIGETTTDVGVLVKGFPREASSQVKVIKLYVIFNAGNFVDYHNTCTVHLLVYQSDNLANDEEIDQFDNFFLLITIVPAITALPLLMYCTCMCMLYICIVYMYLSYLQV